MSRASPYIISDLTSKEKSKETLNSLENLKSRFTPPINVSPILNEESEMKLMLANQNTWREALNKLAVMQNIEEEKTIPITKSNLHSKGMNSVSYLSNQESLPLQPRGNTTVSDISNDELKDHKIIV